jgi:hypothetical protein
MEFLGIYEKEMSLLQERFVSCRKHEFAIWCFGNSARPKTFWFHENPFWEFVFCRKRSAAGNAEGT